MRLGGGEVTQYEVIMKVGEKKEAIGFARLGSLGLISSVAKLKRWC